jgi:hypothetical protein
MGASIFEYSDPVVAKDRNQVYALNLDGHRDVFGKLADVSDWGFILHLLSILHSNGMQPVVDKLTLDEIVVSLRLPVMCRSR